MHRAVVRLLIAAAFLASAASAAGAALQQQETAQADTTKQEKKNENLPLEPGRTVTIDTDQGTWISLDVSPDGRMIVFDLLGDLYLLPFEGGAARQLTSGMAFDGQPRFSPDGAKVLFVSDRSGGENLWTIEPATGDTAQLTKGNGHMYVSPEWAPDGKYVVASRSESRLGVVQLWIGHIDGGSGKVIVDEPENVKTLGAAFTPDGRYIWYARRSGSWNYNAMLPQYQLEVYDRETGERYSRSSRYGSALRPTISPDGRWLVYGTRFEDATGLRIRDLQTGAERWLAYPIQHDDQESIADRDVLPGMSFTPDSRELVTSYGGKIWRIPLDGGEAVEIPFRVTTELEFGPLVEFDYPIEDTPEFTISQIRDAVPAPNGTRLAFTALDRLYVMDWPDGTPRRLTDMEITEAQPTWSPDGRWIAYVTWSEDGGHIYKVRADGRGSPRRLTQLDGVYQQPAWSPDGGRIVAIRGPARAYRESTGPSAPGAAEDLVWVRADGGAPTVIAPTEGRGAPHFTQDPDRIYLFHRDTGLVSIRWDGTDEKAHLKVTGHKRPRATQPNRPDVMLVAPTGEQALALVDNQIYVVTVPYIGGETPSVSITKPENADFPALQLTDIGGQFPAWSGDGRHVHWSIGNAHAVYDLDAARAFADSVKAAKEQEEEEEEEEAAAAEEQEEQEEEKEEKEEEPRYQPFETRIVIQARRDIPQGVVALRGARVITMRGDEVIEDADLVARNNRIVALGARGSLDVPADARVIDVTGTTIIPGFVDPHSHMWPAWGVHKTQDWQYLANLAYGVTTTRDPQTSSTDVLTYGDRVTAGLMIGPRIYSTGPGIFGDYVNDPIEDLEHARRILKRYSEYYDTKTIKMYMAGNRQQRQWVIMASRDQGLMPTTEGGLRFAYELSMIVDGYPGQEHTWPVYPIYQDVIALTAASQMTYTPTLLVAYGGPFSENYFYENENPHDDTKLRHFTPHSEIDQATRRRGQWFLPDEYVFEEHGVALKDVVEAGGRVGIGSHGQLQGLGYHWELWLVAAGGMSNHDALRAATILGAEGIGLDKHLGSLEPGKLADLIVLDANPLDDLRNTNTIRYVMMNGRLFEGDTLNEIWPRQRPLEMPDYWQDDPVGLRAGMRDGSAR
jgi:Tol biopolymer transport system component/imidazolonepropionase-like amidohydrolase